MNTPQKLPIHERGIRIAFVSLIAVSGLVACGSSNKSSSTSAAPSGAATTESAQPTTTAVSATTEVSATTAAPVTTEKSGTTPPVVSEAAVVVDPKNPTCVYRDRELISKATLAEVKAVAGTDVTDIGRITPAGSELAATLHLYRITADPVDIAEKLVHGSPSIAASPNYIFAFAPGWQYAPYDDPVSAPQQHPTPLSSTTAKIVVLDTGWVPTLDPATKTLNVTTPAMSPPGTNPPAAGATSPSTGEVTKGRAAGHGTFIVNMLGQLLPNANFVGAGISPRYTSDDDYIPPDLVPPNNQIVSIRDDFTVTWALAQSVAGGAAFLNLSFGSYGCSARHDPTNSEDMEPYYTPLGFQTALTQLGGSTQVFAASGNDSFGPNGPYPTAQNIFYPAGWAPQYPTWLHSVGSDPKAGTDYSNRGAWVQTQARGSRTVSLLPATPALGERWAEWSGTSFATPCALAKFAAGQFANHGYNVSGSYMECNLNLA